MPRSLGPLMHKGQAAILVNGVFLECMEMSNLDAHHSIISWYSREKN